MIRAGAMLALLLASPSALAGGPPRVQLDYLRVDGARRCPAEKALKARVAARLGYDPFDESSTRRLRVSVGNADRGLRARLEMTDLEGSLGVRTISSPRRDCVDLGPTLELAIALAIDPSTLWGKVPPPHAEPPPTPAPAPAAATEARDDRPDWPPRPPPAARPWQFRIGLGALVTVGLAPAVAYGVATHLGVGYGRWSLDLEARFDPPTSQSAQVGQVQVWSLLGSLVPCFHVSLLAVCGLVSLGGQFGRGDGYDVPVAASGLLAGLGLRAAIEVPIGQRIVLQFSGEARATLAAPTLSLAGQELFAPSPVWGGFGLGVRGHLL